MKKIVLAMVISMVTGLFAAEKVPSYQEISKNFRLEHPRLFLTAEMIPAVKKHALSDGKVFFDQLKKRVESYSEDPKLELRTDRAKIVDGKIKIFKHVDTYQDNAAHAYYYVGGKEAADCALYYLVTGDRAAARKGAKYLKVMADFVDMADRSKMLTQWYNYERISALTACDWLWDTMTPEERADFIRRMLRHVKHMNGKPGYHYNHGEYASGNYGERALLWYVGVLAYKAGVDDALAEELLKRGYQHSVRTMDYREEMSGGKGVLTSICNEYSIQAYPYNTFFFLYTLRSFAGLDGIRYWTQPLEFPNYVNWIMIPSRHSSTGFRDFGWGDIWHFNNELRTLKLYSHMAQTLHLYGENRPARMVMALLKGKNRNLDQLREMQFLPLLMTGFRPNTAQEDAELVIQRGKIAEFFPSYGLMVARSGMGEDDTYFSCKTGATQTGHQHYDENSFVLYKKGYLALDTGTRNNLPHHKAYYPQSVAHNTMLVRIPGQPLPRHWYPQNAPKFPEGLTNDGGQNQQGKAKHLGFYCNEFYASTAGDAALCYPKGTVQEATRIFVFVKPDHCVIYDRMETVPEGKKVFLLHTQGGLQLENGIWTTAAEEGKLFLRTLLPAKVKHEIVGGEGKEFMTNGVNYPVNPDKVARYNGKVWLGKYRLELSPEKDGSSLRMLHLLQAADGKVTEATPAEVIQTATHDGVKFQTADGAECTVLFARTGKAGGTIKITRDGKVLTARTLW